MAGPSGHTLETRYGDVAVNDEPLESLRYAGAMVARSPPKTKAQGSSPWCTVKDQFDSYSCCDSFADLAWYILLLVATHSRDKASWAFLFATQLS